MIDNLGICKNIENKKIYTLNITVIQMTNLLSLDLELDFGQIKLLIKTVSCLAASVNANTKSGDGELSGRLDS
jgi:hypothetical protein